MKKRNLKGIINVFLLGVVSLVNDFSSEMIMPILPMFISALGGGGLVIGLIAGLRESISSILKVFFGYWSDKAGKRKIFIYSGYLTSSFFKLFLALSKTWQHILVFAGLERIGKGLRSAAIDSVVAESMPKQKGEGFGIHRTLDTSGAILGSVAAFILFWFLGAEFKTIILIAAVVSFFSLIPFYFVKERKRKPQNISLKISLKELSKPLRAFILISGVFALANFSYMFFILRAQGIFTGRLAIGVPIFLYILFNVFYAVFAVPFGVFSDKFGRKKTIILGYGLFSITCLGFIFFNSLTAFIVLFAVYGIVHALIEGNQRAYIADLSPEKLKATSLGTFHTTVGLAALPASLIAGGLWQINPNITFIYGAVIAAVPVVLFGIFRKYFKDEHSV